MLKNEMSRKMYVLAANMVLNVHIMIDIKIWTSEEEKYKKLCYSRGIGYANRSGWVVMRVFLMWRRPTP